MIPEHALVIFIKEKQGFPDIGTRGTVVHIYQEGKAYEVEVPMDDGPGAMLFTVEAEYLMQHPVLPTKEAWDAAEHLVERLKAGEITVEELRRLRDGQRAAERDG